MKQVEIADTPEKILKCWEVIYALRPHLVQDEFVALIQKMQADKFTLLFIEEAGKAVSAAGFVEGIKLHRGKYIYIDDLSTLTSHRGKGLGTALLDWIFDYAQKNSFNQVHLDSGVQRFDAHRLYLNYGFNISSHHFVKVIQPT